MLLWDGVASPSSRARPDRLRTIAGFASRHRVLLALTAVGAAIRWATITSQSYWLDESQAAHEVSLSFAHMLSAWSAVEGNPPLYLVLAWGWAHTALPRIVSLTVPANVRSWRVMERIGMARRPDLDFGHPLFPEGHPLHRHVVYAAERRRLT